MLWRYIGHSNSLEAIFIPLLVTPVQRGSVHLPSGLSSVIVVSPLKRDGSDHLLNFYYVCPPSNAPISYCAKGGLLIASLCTAFPGPFSWEASLTLSVSTVVLIPYFVTSAFFSIISVLYWRLLPTLYDLLSVQYQHGAAVLYTTVKWSYITSSSSSSSS